MLEAAYAVRGHNSPAKRSPCTTVVEHAIGNAIFAAVGARVRHLPIRPAAVVQALANWFAHFAALDNPTSSRRTRQLLDWQPKEPGLIADLDQPHYF